MKRALLALTLAVALGTAGPAAAAGRSTVPDLLASWLAVQEDPTQWAVAWLQYEAAHSRLLDQAFYGLYQPREKAELLEQFTQSHVSELPTIMHNLGGLYHGWDSDYAAVRDGFSREFGRVPALEVNLLFAAAPQTITYAVIDNKPSLSLNARLMLPYSPERMRVRLARLLYPFLASDKPVGMAGRTVRSVLQSEGLAGLMADRMVPEAALEDLLQVEADQVGRYRSLEAGFCREVLLALDSKAPDQVERFFGPKPPAGWPLKPGRYVGLLVAQELAKTMKPQAIAALDEKAFAEKARPILKRLASSAGL